MSYDIVYNDPSFGTYRAPYSSENDAVTQALHDMQLGKAVQHIQDGDSGAIVWSGDQLRTKLGG